MKMTAAYTEDEEGWYCLKEEKLGEWVSEIPHFVSSLI